MTSPFTQVGSANTTFTQVGSVRTTFTQVGSVRIGVLAVSFLLAGAACSKSRVTPSGESAEAKGAAPAAATKETPKPSEPPKEQKEKAAVTDAQPGQAPDNFTVEFDTTKGALKIDVHRDWAPRGADRFHELVTTGFFEDIALFRVINGFMAQGGIHGDPKVAAQWRDKRIPDDAVKQSNTRGRVTFAMAGPNTRTTQFFINLVDNSRLDSMGFAPFGEIKDMGVMDQIYSGYGEGAPQGRGPSQGLIQARGNEYLKADFPKLDYIKSARIVE